MFSKHLIEALSDCGGVHTESNRRPRSGADGLFWKQLSRVWRAAWDKRPKGNSARVFGISLSTLST